MLIVPILPLILDYLDIPFELIQVNKSFNTNSKKYCLTWVTDKLINKDIIKFHKFKNITFTGDDDLRDDDIINRHYNLKHLKKLYLSWSINLTYNILPFLPELKTLSVYDFNYKSVNVFNTLTHLDIFMDANMADYHLEHFRHIEVLKLDCNNKITDAGLRYLQNIKVLGLPDNTKITKLGLKYINGCYLRNLKLGYKNYNIVAV